MAGNTTVCQRLRPRRRLCGRTWPGRGAEHSSIVAPTDTWKRSGGRQQRLVISREGEDGGIQADLRGFACQRAARSVGFAGRQKIPGARAAADGQPARQAGSLLSLRGLCAASDRHRSRRRQEPRGTEGIPDQGDLRRRAARRLGPGRAAKGQRGRWGRGRRFVHDPRLPHLLAEGCRAAGRLLSRLQRLARRIRQL